MEDLQKYTEDLNKLSERFYKYNFEKQDVHKVLDLSISVVRKQFVILLTTMTLISISLEKEIKSGNILSQDICYAHTMLCLFDNIINALTNIAEDFKFSVSKDF